MADLIGDVQKTERGFEFIKFTDHCLKDCSIQQSSAIDDTQRGMEQPGSSFLWLGREDGDRMHLHRDQVRQLCWVMQFWLQTGRLNVPQPDYDKPLTTNH